MESEKSIFWKDRNVLVTGAGGFIGNAVAWRMWELGARVTCVVQKSCDITNSLPFDNKAYVAAGDVTDYYFLRDLISKREIDTIFHLAARSIVRISAKDPLSTFNTNVMGTVALLEAARNVGKCRSIVVASSDKAYGDHNILPYTENHFLIPKNTYDTSKACADLIAQTYHSNYCMPVSVTRCSNVYGPRDMNLSRLIPNSCIKVAEYKNPIVYSDIENMEREFIFIDDVADAYEAISRNALVGPYNIGGNGPMKIIDVINLICKFGGSNVSIDVVERDPEFKEILKQCIDSSKLKAATGWEPKTAIEDGLEKTYYYYYNKLQEYKQYQ